MSTIKGFQNRNDHCRVFHGTPTDEERNEIVEQSTRCGSCFDVQPMVTLSVFYAVLWSDLHVLAILWVT
ncbi:hypothetical protein NECAME_15383 [Necator americanus]|uniref:Uncharacterized protein n=1 Tax=Necator americanus TaxID=51031 RepID=W2SIF6_NECAM|nr:hypothetical protein NECAME_15383 [Necator americanus]ETN69338.1 hypothetical protein NECAME_15383 [Necator americanus]